MSSDYDTDDYGTTLDDVCDRLDSIEHAIRENRSNLSWVWVVIIVWLVVTGIANLWYSKWRDSWWYNVGSDQITVAKKPTDCDFLHAPLGNKGCRYERQVAMIQVKTKYVDMWRGSVNYVSFDEGKTWTEDNSAPPRKPQVVISWEKVEE